MWRNMPEWREAQAKERRLGEEYLAPCVSIVESDVNYVPASSPIPLMDNSKYYDIMEIAAGTYAFDPTNTVRVPTVQNYLVALSSASPEKEADDEALLSCVTKNMEKFADEEKLFVGVDMTAPPKWKSHPALERYQKGVK